VDHEQIVSILKQNYPRDVRKQLVKSVLSNEKADNKAEVQQQYNIINQIFSYVLKECNWSMPSNSNEIDHQPLKIMNEVFPKLDTTKWFNDQLLMTKKSINVVIGDGQK
jgi:DNA-binding ferritin-like protein